MITHWSYVFLALTHQYGFVIQLIQIRHQIRVSKKDVLISSWRVTVFARNCSSHALSWWRNQTETFSALLGLCAGNSPVTGEFPSQRPVTRSFDVFFDLCLNKRLSKQLRRRWFEMPSCSLWRHCNVGVVAQLIQIHIRFVFHTKMFLIILWRVAVLTRICSSHAFYEFQHISPGQDGRYFADDSFRCIFVNEQFSILINIFFIKFVPKASIDNNSALVKIMAWCWIGDKALSELMLTQFTDAYMRHQREMS